MSESAPAVFRVVINAPIERVWQELTNTNEVLPFFFNSRLDTNGLTPGGQIRMCTKSGKYTGVIGEVLEYDPPHRYSHTFKFTQLDDPPCTVTYELKPLDGSTEFTLTASALPIGMKTEKYMRQGGEFIISTLKAVVEGKPLSLGARFTLLMCALMEPLTPRRALSENWPL